MYLQLFESTKSEYFKISTKASMIPRIKHIH